jgi:Flp pilus assembly pilin Flp
MRTMWCSARRRGGAEMRRPAHPADPGASPRGTWAGQAGQGMIEYALIGGILIVGAVAVLTALSKSLNDLFSAISSTLAQY